MEQGIKTRLKVSQARCQKVLPFMEMDILGWKVCFHAVQLYDYVVIHEAIHFLVEMKLTEYQYTCNNDKTEWCKTNAIWNDAKNKVQHKNPKKSKGRVCGSIFGKGLLKRCLVQLPDSRWLWKTGRKVEPSPRTKQLMIWLSNRPGFREPEHLLLLFLLLKINQ